MRRQLILTSVVAAVLFLAPESRAQNDAAAHMDTVQVTATRAAVPVLHTPASISVVSGEQLRARLATDLRSALAVLAGVEISPGGDAGPASAVPALWGLREFDAFLLVVDGVPWGGAFNPDLKSLDLQNVDRIEVLRGAAPVMYGATSFVGVINIIHRPAGAADERAGIVIGGVEGNPGSWTTSIVRNLPDAENWRQSVAVDLRDENYADRRAGSRRAHMRYRLGAEQWHGTTSFDFDFTANRQKPLSPYPRVSDGLDPVIDTDANFHPADAKMADNRLHLALSHSRNSQLGDWTSTLAVSNSHGGLTRGFLSASCAGTSSPTENACGHGQDRTITDVYFDTHLQTRFSDSLSAVWGLDELFGKGEQQARIFAYAVDPLHGNDAPRSAALSVLEQNDLEVERNFFGAYGQLSWNLAPAVDVLLGLRINHTREVREGEEDLPGGPVAARESQLNSEPSGMAGLTWQAWATSHAAITLFADYRDTFKPAAVDFGPEAEATILDAELGQSREFGVKSYWNNGILTLDVTLFDMIMDNLVVPQSVNGSPSLVNAGILFLQGTEVEATWQPLALTSIYVAYAHHKLRYGNYERLFDGVPVQLKGNSPELAPDNTGALGLEHASAGGWRFSAAYSYTGSRYLNKRNTSKAASFAVLDASIGKLFGKWQLALVMRNLTDARDPVSESELGDGQYYRMSARTVSLALSVSL